MTTREAMLEDAVLAARMHNIAYGTGQGVQLSEADVLRYNNLANIDPLITFKESVDTPSAGKNTIGLHTDTSTLLQHEQYRRPAEKVMYFDDTPLEKDNDAAVALRTSGFDTAQRNAGVEYYGRRNSYDIRGFDGVLEAQEMQRNQFKAIAQPRELYNRMNADIVNATSTKFSASVTAPKLETLKLPRRNVGGDKGNLAKSAAYLYKPTLGATGGAASMLEQLHSDEQKEAQLQSFLIQTGTSNGLF